MIISNDLFSIKISFAEIIGHPDFLLREFELVTEPEDMEGKNEHEKNEAEKMKVNIVEV